MPKLVKLLQLITRRACCAVKIHLFFDECEWPGGKALNAQQIAQTQKLHVGQILPESG